MTDWLSISNNKTDNQNNGLLLLLLFYQALNFTLHQTPIVTQSYRLFRSAT